ncbi:MAG: peptide chain release factor N(5)-glutamine methyltransferase [Bacteroidota bacterium]|nr:peptide chain release factor N(5)-glutamine methyltransferase [Bacteroidota bacterium]
MAQETVLSLIRKSAAFFTEKGIGEAKLSAEHLLAHVLRQKRLQMYLRFDQPVSDDELAEFRALVRRRLNHEPVQYIVGSTEFYGLELAVTPAVLIPRPDTEHLIDAVLDFHKQGQLQSDLRVLDIGTGSGAIAIALAVQLPGVHVTATDISLEALALAGENAARHGLDGRIAFSLQDIFDGSIEASHVPYDVVASNPPYIPKAELDELQPEIRDFEPLIAATDGGDGLRFYRRIAERVDTLLAPGGLLVLEVGAGQAASVMAMLEQTGLRDIAARKDYGGIERVVTAWK